MSFGQIQFLLEASLFQFGEYFVLLPMLPDDAQRPFSLACQVINPLRVKTLVDVRDSNVRNGVELGPFGEAVAYWVKKAEPNGQSVNYWSDVKQNFLRIPAKRGHRRLVIHNFVTKSTEEVRGWPLLAPAVKMFRDFSDLVDVERARGTDHGGFLEPDPVLQGPRYQCLGVFQRHAWPHHAPSGQPGPGNPPGSVTSVAQSGCKPRCFHKGIATHPAHCQQPQISKNINAPVSQSDRILYRIKHPGQVSTLDAYLADIPVFHDKL